MVKVYAVSLVIGVVGLLVVVLGGAFAENVGREERDPGRLIGVRGKSVVGGLVGFGMGGDVGGVLSTGLQLADCVFAGAGGPGRFHLLGPICTTQTDS